MDAKKIMILASSETKNAANSEQIKGVWREETKGVGWVRLVWSINERNDSKCCKFMVGICLRVWDINKHTSFIKAVRNQISTCNQFRQRKFHYGQDIIVLYLQKILHNSYGDISSIITKIESLIVIHSQPNSHPIKKSWLLHFFQNVNQAYCKTQPRLSCLCVEFSICKKSFQSYNPKVHLSFNSWQASQNLMWHHTKITTHCLSKIKQEYPPYHY